ncbi:MAG TPA: TIGR03915 family putative DNA repair protein [Methylotenera sp.]|nr:TIGR03915 family putative DNA repair protein [Methylotenera sp.]
MQLVRLKCETDFEGWRNAARSLLAQGIAPEEVVWRVSNKITGLFDTPNFVPTQTQGPQLTVPRDFLVLCKTAILYRDPARFGLLYRLLWRLRKEPDLLQVAFDPDVLKVRNMAQAVQRDLHKMKAFVRFKEVHIQENDKVWSGFIAWFEPSHFVVQASAPFFTGRFTNMHWSILTPDICMHWDGEKLSYSQGANKIDAPTEDAGEDLWRAYYRSIFNPARLKVSAMQAQMPKKYWHNLPEAELISELIVNADKRKDEMIAALPTEPQRKIVKYIAERKG